MGIYYLIVAPRTTARATWYFAGWYNDGEGPPRWTCDRAQAEEFVFKADADIVLTVCKKSRPNMNVSVEPRLNYVDIGGWYARHPLSQEDKWDCWKRHTEEHDKLQLELEYLDSTRRDPWTQELDETAGKTLLVIMDHVRLEAVLMSAFAKELRN